MGEELNHGSGLLYYGIVVYVSYDDFLLFVYQASTTHNYVSLFAFWYVLTKVWDHEITQLLIIVNMQLCHISVLPDMRKVTFLPRPHF